MAISRDRVNNNLHRVMITFEGEPEPLNVWIAPNMITPAFQRVVKRESAQMQARRSRWEKDRQSFIDRGEDIPENLSDEDALDREEQQEQMRMLTLVIKRWDLLERDPSEEEPNPPVLPITFETLEGLGYLTIGRISQEIVASLEVDPTNSRSTGNGSAPAAVTVISRNGRS